MNNSHKDDQIKSVFTRPDNDKIVYSPSGRKLTETEEFFGPQKSKPASLAETNPTIQSFESTSLPPKDDPKAPDAAVETSKGEAPEEIEHPEIANIEVQQYDVPTKKTIGDIAETPNQGEQTDAKMGSYDAKPQPLPPIRGVNTSLANTVATIISIFVLALGLSGGYFGYSYINKLMSGQKVAADTQVQSPGKTIDPQTLPSPTVSPAATPSKSTDATANWSVYKNTKYNYTLKYPDSWYAQNVSNEQSESVSITSFKPTQTGSDIQSGYKVEVTFQDAKGKLLKDWITANNALTGNAKLTALSVDGKDAYQQTVEAVGKSVNTYVFQAGKIMIITYYGAEKDFTTGQTLYDTIIKNIKLL